MNIKQLLWIVPVLLAVFLGASLKRNIELDKKYKTAMANIKQYDYMLGESNRKNAAFQLTLDQLKSYQDTILRALHNTQK